MTAKLAFIAFFLSLFGTDPADIPQFKGGQEGLSNFISRSIIYPEYSKFNCIQGTIQVSFRLTKTGRITQSKVQQGLGVDLDDEALRVVRLTSGKWKVPSGFDTTQFITIPINFSLKEYNCESRTKEEVKSAIAAYHTREDLSNAVINYYQHKDKANPEDEQKILAIKEQLGFTEQFIDRVIKQAAQKLKQGDKEGACEDLNFVKNIGSNKADKLINDNCSK